MEHQNQQITITEARLAALIDARLAAFFSRAVEARPTPEAPPTAGGWLFAGDAGNPLGRKQTAAIARRRLTEGKGGAGRVGKRYCLNREALAEELAALGQRDEAPAEPDAVERLRAELEGGAL